MIRKKIEDTAKETFTEYDKNGDGFITKDEVQKTVQSK